MNTHIATLLGAALLAVSPLRAQCGDHRPSEPAKPKARAANTICPVMGEAVNVEKNRSVLVRSRYYLVCCGKCADELYDFPGKYLGPDGRPLNAPKEDPAKEAPADPPPAPEHHH